MHAFISIGRFFIFWAVVVSVVLGGLVALLRPAAQSVGLPATSPTTWPSPLAAEKSTLPLATLTTSGLELGVPEDETPSRVVAPNVPLSDPTGTPSLNDLRARVVSTAASLRSGTLTAEMTYKDGSRASTRVRFDLGDGQHPPRQHVVSSYESATGLLLIEQIVLGDRVWQRQGYGPWAIVPGQVGVDEALRAFLPQVQAAPNLQLTVSQGAVALGWYDAGRNADMVLLADPVTGLPQQLTQVPRNSDTVLDITYLSWNDPVTIEPPAGQ